MAKQAVLHRSPVGSSCESSWRTTLLILLLPMALLVPLLAVAEDWKRPDVEAARNRNREWSQPLPGMTLEPHWFSASTTGDDSQATRFWFLERAAGGQKLFWIVNPAAATKIPAFDHEKLAKALSDQRQKPVEAKRLPFDELTVEKDHITFTIGKEGYRWTDATAELTVLETPDKPTDEPRGEGRRGGRRSPPRLSIFARSNTNPSSPDGRFKVSIDNSNVALEERATGKREVLTTDGKPGDSYDNRVYWSPDSTHFVVIKTKAAQEHPIHHIESSPTDRVEPKLHTQNYLKPGDEIALPRPHLFRATDFAEIPVDNSLFPNPWSLDALAWIDDSSAFRFLYNQRGHQSMRLIEVAAATGVARVIVADECETFFDYTNKLVYLPIGVNQQQVIWASERSGYNHLYRFETPSPTKSAEDSSKAGETASSDTPLDKPTGRHVPVTQGEWVVRSVEHVDQTKGIIWLRISGYFHDQDPYYQHFARVNFDGTGFQLLTSADGTHEASFSPDRKYLVTTWSRVDHAPVHELRDGVTGKLILELGRVDMAPLLAKGWQPPVRFVAKGRDGQTDIYGVVYFPSWSGLSATATQQEGASPGKFPILEKIYAGPHGSFVPKNFGNSRYENFLAELGFVVVQIDGMGTNHRSKAFHDVCWKNLIDSGFPDRKLWITAAAKKWPAMDLSRVGIYGGSAGGQSSTQAVLHHSDFYQVAVSDCGCHDNRMDKIWWNEMWMSWPVGPHYAEQSNVTNAHKLGGKLLLIVGERDENVDPASTTQVVSALIKANKDFDFLMIPGAGHGAAETPYGSRRRLEFLMEHLRPEGTPGEKK